MFRQAGFDLRQRLFCPGGKEKGRPRAALFSLRLLHQLEARSKRSRFMTFVQAATKSFANFSFASAQP